MKKVKMVLCSMFLGLSAFASESTFSGGSQSKQESVEVNALWPIFPGGISEFKYLIPVGKNSSSNSNTGGKLILGLYSDYASKVVRNDDYGKVVLLAFKLGYRHYLMSGWHAEIANNLGWRQEKNRPGAGTPVIEGWSSRLWVMAGYEQNLTSIFYINYRLGAGVHLYRSDEYADTEKKLVVGGDINLGVRF